MFALQYQTKCHRSGYLLTYVFYRLSSRYSNFFVLLQFTTVLINSK